MNMILTRGMSPRFDLIAILALAGSELSLCRQLLFPACRAGLSRTPLIIFRLPGVRAGAWSRARTRHITQSSHRLPAHCLTQLASVTRPVSPVITKWLDCRKI